MPAGEMKKKAFMMLYDSHCHLDMLSKPELAEALAAAKRAGVAGMISCSTSFSSCQRNLEIASLHGEVRAALGLYPLDALGFSDEQLDRAFDFFRQNASKKEVAGIGEVGLDYKLCVGKEEHEKQAGILRRFAALSKESGKPLVMHSRYAQRQALALLVEEGAEKVLMHSFVDSSKLMKKAAESGFFVSVGMCVLENEEVQKRVAAFPIENLLFETDAPIRFNNEKAMPEKVAMIARKVAELKGVPLDELEKAQEKSFGALFGFK